MSSRANDRTALQIAEEAARIIADEGLADYQLAKNKALRRLGLPSQTRLPNNKEIEHALIARQSLFSNEEQSESLRYLREITIDVMQVLAEFDPHVVGPVLKGTASSDDVIHLHVFSEDAKNVAIALLNQNIDFVGVERRITKQNPEGIKGFRFHWQSALVEALVFPDGRLRVSPPSPVDGKPMARADRETLMRIMGEISG